jgi:[acyl-carrier-protein] S-malonyltransferase
MADAANGLAEYLKNVEFSEPEIPIYSNYTAQPYEGDYKALVKAQVENPVRWQKIVENMVESGVDTFIEVGVGKTLMNLIKRINPDVKKFKFEVPSDFDKISI